MTTPAKGKLGREGSAALGFGMDNHFATFTLEHSNLAFLLLGKDARILKVNQAAGNQIRGTKKELLGMTAYDLDPCFSPEAWPAHWEELRKVKFLRFQSCQAKKDGSTFPTEIGTKFVNESEKNVYVIILLHATERLKALEEQQQDEANQLQPSLAGNDPCLCKEAASASEEWRSHADQFRITYPLLTPTLDNPPVAHLFYLLGCKLPLENKSGILLQHDDIAAGLLPDASLPNWRISYRDARLNFSRIDYFEDTLTEESVSNLLSRALCFLNVPRGNKIHIPAHLPRIKAYKGALLRVFANLLATPSKTEENPTSTSTFPGKKNWTTTPSMSLTTVWASSPSTSPACSKCSRPPSPMTKAHPASVWHWSRRVSSMTGAESRWNPNRTKGSPSPVPKSAARTSSKAILPEAVLSAIGTIKKTRITPVFLAFLSLAAIPALLPAQDSQAQKGQQIRFTGSQRVRFKIENHDPSIPVTHQVYPGVRVFLEYLSPDQPVKGISKPNSDFILFNYDPTNPRLIQLDRLNLGLEYYYEFQPDVANPRLARITLDLPANRLPDKLSQVRVTGNLALLSDRQTAIDTTPSVPLMIGETLNAGPFSYTIHELRRPDFSNDALEIALVPDKDTLLNKDNILHMHFFDQTGKTVRTTFKGSISMNQYSKEMYSLNINPGRIVAEIVYIKLENFFTLPINFDLRDPVAPKGTR